MKHITILLALAYIVILLFTGFHSIIGAQATFGASSEASNNIINPGSAMRQGMDILSKTNPLCADNEKEGALGLLMLLFLLAICVIIIFLLLRFHIHWFPESVGVILVGVAVGVVIRIIPSFELPALTQMDPTLFFEILLPAIIFEAGYTLEKEDFFYNIGSIILFAFIGTAISTIVVATGIYMLAFTGIFRVELGIIDCFLFGSLISAVDPVATLAIFNALKVNPTLHYLVFGESIVNDAVAITLFTTFKAFKTATGSSTTQTVLKGIGIFTLNSVGSVIFALICGFASALFFRFVDMRQHPTLEITLFISFAYGPYLFGLPYLSGIMIILISGIIMSYYTAPNMSQMAQNTISNISKSIAFIAETIVFIYLGLACFSFANQHWDLALIVVVLALCMIGRFLNIVPLSAIVNFYRKEKISMKNQFIMWFSGLRGAIAFALAIEFLSPEEGVEGQYLFTTTLAVVLFTIVVFGGGTYPFLKLLKVKSKDEELAERGVGGTTSAAILRERSLHEELALKIDARFFRKWFVRPAVMDQMHSDLRAATEEARKIHEVEKAQELGDVENLHNVSFHSNNGTGEVDEDKDAMLNSFISNPQKLAVARQAIAMYDRSFNQ